MLFSTFHVHCRFETCPNPPSESQEMQVVRTICSSAAKTSTLFDFVILIITMLPFNGNSMTSGEGGCITHCYGMDVEVDGPKAFAKSAGIFCPIGHSKFLQV